MGNGALKKWGAGILGLALSVQVAAAQTDSGMVDTTMAGMKVLEWKQRAPGVWSAMIGKPEIGTMAFAEAPRLDALKEMGEPVLPQAMGWARGDVHGGYASARFPLGKEEHIYGLGMRADSSVDLRGKSYQLRVTPASHAPTPFYISSAGYGVVINAARVLNIQVGVSPRRDSPNHPPERDRTTDGEWGRWEISDAVEANAVGTGMEVFLFAGKTPLEVVRRYNLYCGGGCLPARWGLGFWHRVHTRTTAAQALAEVEDFAQHDIPLDVLGLEPGWQSASYPCTYEWDPTRFPDPAAFVRAMTAKGISVNLWENMFVSRKAPIFKQLEPYACSHTYWRGHVPDYTLPAAVEVLTTQHRRGQLDIGVSGYKVDEVDELDTLHMLFPSGLCGEQMRQIHGLIIQKAYMDMFRGLNRRTCGLVRGSNAGGSPYPFALYSDTYAHRGFIAALANSSLAGVLWCSEVRGATSDEDWVRRFQTALFSPVMQLNGWQNGIKPWSRAAATDLVREQLKLRMRLIPYLYTAMADYHRYGIPPIRHMILEMESTSTFEETTGKVDGLDHPRAESRAMEVSDQYMFGPSILVAPLIAGEKSRKVVLPKGKWFDFYTGKLAGEGTTITASAPLNQIPLFVKDGGIVPLMPAVNNVRLATGAVPLEVRHYGLKEGVYQLYDDDGETFDYEKGVFCRQEFKVVCEGGQLKGEAGPSAGPWKSRYSTIAWKFMTEVSAERIMPGGTDEDVAQVAAARYAPEGKYMKDHCLIYKDGQWHLFAPLGPVGSYWRKAGAEKTAEHMVSKDLVNWTHLGTAVGPTGIAGAYDETMTGIAPHVILHKGVYYMSYSGWKGGGGGRDVFMATSPDLNQWTKVATSLNGLGLFCNDQHVVRDEANNRWLMYGWNNQTPIYQSKDLLHWTKAGQLKSRAGESPFVMHHPLSGKWILFANDGYSLSDDPLDFPQRRPYPFKSGLVWLRKGPEGQGNFYCADDDGTGFAHEVVQGKSGQWYLTGVVGTDGHTKLKLTPILWTEDGVKLGIAD
jgi:alpha-D-xyloside xylohydrolase